MVLPLLLTLPRLQSLFPEVCVLPEFRTLRDDAEDDFDRCRTCGTMLGLKRRCDLHP